MRVAFFDCFSGISGDMLLAACLDAGLELETLRADLAGLGIQGYAIDSQSIRKQGFAARCFDVKMDASVDQPHRHLKHIREIIEKSSLPEEARSRSMAIFTHLAEAEAAVHGTTIEKVHFHEVGAVDAIVDIVGAVIALQRLGIDRVYCSPIPTGSGTVKCEHGLLPVPAPVTSVLLKGVPLAQCDETGELTTPTGAAIATTLAEDFGPMPAMVIEQVGVGAGRREGEKRPNIMRIFIGELPVVSADGDESDEIVVLEANLDDISAEVVGYVYDRLFDAGALDVFTMPIYMKKNRPGTLLTVLAPPALRGKIEAIIFAETTTFGVRSHFASRRKLSRSMVKVETEDGPIRIKVGARGDQIVTASPEFEDCREVAGRTGKPLSKIMENAIQIWRATEAESNKNKTS